MDTARIKHSEEKVRSLQNHGELQKNDEKTGSRSAVKESTMINAIRTSKTKITTT